MSDTPKFISGTEHDHLLPEEARKLRQFFKHERLAESKLAGVQIEVDAEDVTILSVNGKRRANPEAIVLVMSAKGVALKIPVTRQLLKRLKREFEQEENWRKRFMSGDTPHAVAISKHNEIHPG
jgi:hypothetical protein